MNQLAATAVALILSLVVATCCVAQTDTNQADPDQRANALQARMTQDEKFKLVLGFFGADLAERGHKKHPDALPDSAGYVEGIARLGIPALFETDGGLGVASQPSDHPRERTALPSGLALAATWNPALAQQAGVMIGAEARASGFNVMLAGAVNLTREPRNGRNFEYAGEDPLLAGIMVAQQIKGIESNHLIATMKHFALNAQETGRSVLDARIDEAQLRMSDLLAMQLVIERADPGAVMCAYNRVNGVYACQNDFLLNQVLKGDWHYPGFVMSDWGATHSSALAANHGLDQESGWEFDDLPYFGGALQTALQDGALTMQRLDNMVHRILRSMIAKGLLNDLSHPNSAIDFEAHGAISRQVAEQAMVLLKNRHHLLPLPTTLRSILVIGAHADVGVLSGGGSSQVYPVGGMAVPGLLPAHWPGPVVYFPSAPYHAIRQQAPDAEVLYYDGDDPALAAKLASQADVVIVFADQWAGEDNGLVSLNLPGQQNALIQSVSTANASTVVVLETDGPVLMPWLPAAGAVLEAWYPGSQGAVAIARVLFGAVNPSGHVPLTFPRSEQQLPRPVLDGVRTPPDRSFAVSYNEGAAIGYKWFARSGMQPLFPFGYGLSYTTFMHRDLALHCQDSNCQVAFTVANRGHCSGQDVAQVYAIAPRHVWEARERLAGWAKVELAPGHSQRVKLTIDPRLLAVFDVRDRRWHIRAGHYQVVVARHAGDPRPLRLHVDLQERTLSMQGQPE